MAENEITTRIEVEFDRGKTWVCCPHCGKKMFPVEDDTHIRNLILRCKNSKCKREMKINIG